MIKPLEHLQEHPGQVILIATALYLILGFWQDGLNLDAGMYATVARNVAESGNWLSLHFTNFYHQQFAEHPPLGIWGMAVVFKIFGASDATSRIIGALSAFGTVALIYLIGREALGKTFGFIAALLLLICINFISITNSALLDGPVTFFMVLAYWSVANPDKAKSRLPIGGAALGLAFLSKGLVAVPAFITLFLYVMLFRRDLLRAYQPYLATALALGIPALFLLAEMTVGPNVFWKHYFGVQLNELYDDIRPALHTQWYRFFWRYLTLFFPWSIFSLVGFALIIKNRQTRLALIFVALFNVIFVYSFSNYGYNHYYAPVYPVGALIAAYPIYLYLQNRGKTLGRFPLYFLGVLIFSFCIIPFTNLKIHHLRMPDINKLTPIVKEVLVNSPTQNGVVLGRNTINWNLNALSIWYWNSSLKFMTDDNYGVQDFIADPQFAYLLTPTGFLPAKSAAEDGRLILLSETKTFNLYTRTSAAPPTKTSTEPL
ncbi:glycosyltransferase family 39 protein [bacterium AH-315-J21]|nr:glycosyltransferase family 39 protein [bacterium AH-315-J21]